MDTDAHVMELIGRAALDFADARSWESSATYLRLVDRFNDADAHGYRTSGGGRFVLTLRGRLRGNAGDETIRQFFTDAHEAYAIAKMNPMRDEDEDLGEAFDRAVRESFRRRLAPLFPFARTDE